MAPRFLRISLLTPAWYWVLLAAALPLVAACDAGPSAPAAANGREPSSRSDPPLQLESREQWARLNPTSPMLVSPSFSPDGRWIAASGWGGVGLHVIAAQGSAEPQVLDPSYRGPRVWSSEPLALHFGDDEPRAWSPTAAGFGPGSPLWQRPFVEEWGELVKQDARASWYHHPREGTVTLVQAGQAPVLIVEAGAWGVEVSPDDSMMVWSTGTLAEPTLHLYDVRSGRRQPLGRGAQPAWFPDSRYVVLTEPAGKVRRGAHDTFAAAELALCDARTGERWALTDTADLAEMEPAVAPDGRSLAFADWHSGVIYRASIRQEAPR